MSTTSPPALPAGANPHPPAGNQDRKPPLWVIAHQELETDFSNPDQPSDVWTVTFETRSGVRAYVKIPAGSYTAHNVAAAVEHMAEQIEAVHQLHGKTS